MRELDPHSSPDLPACAVVGAGRLGTVLATGLRARGPLTRGNPVPDDVDAVLLCVPDGQIAAAAMAANFLVALEAAAERLAATAGVTRAQLAPLVLATAAQWAALGPEAALTGPIARGDEEVVARHRTAIAERAPELLALFDALAEQTRAVAAVSA